MRDSLENLKKENGITLVALIITVVVMLILAGVSISDITDGEGLFTKTRGAEEGTKMLQKIKVIKFNK